MSFQRHSGSSFVYFITLPPQRGRVLYCISFFLLLLLYPAGAAAGSYIASVSSSSYTVAVGDLHSRSRRLCFVSVRFLSSVNISKSYISDMTWPILTRLGHKYRLTIPFMSYDQIRVKGHVGVTGVKKVIFTKKISSPTGYVAWSRDLCIW